MADWQRRSVLATGATLSAGGLLASLGSGDRSTETTPPLEKPDGWSSYAGNTGNTRSVSAPDGFEKPDLIDWQYGETGDAVAAGEMVYLRTGAGVHGLDSATGECLWTCERIEAAGTPAVADETVFVAGSQLTAIDAASGSVQWSKRFGEAADTSAPVAAFDSVYLTVDGTLYAFAADDGSLRWTCETVRVTPDQTDDSGAVSYVFSTQPTAVAAVEGSVIGLLDGRRSEDSIDADAVVAFDPLSGTTQRSAQLRAGDFGNGIAATDEAVFVENDGEEGVTSLADDTKERERFISDALTTAAVGDRTVTRGRYELKMTGPDSEWCKNGSHAYGPPAIIDDTVVVAHSAPGSANPDEIVGYRLDDGHEEWCFTFDETQWSDGFNEACLVTEDTVYVDREEGLTALCPRGERSQ
ncbi:outer membrane protein assembly factor BamB family protein [Natronococcus occultus]|uniref:WD40-like repeat protein n=1 Tax=Natronococcus occultus SP4 TaxID=694430 RepID=L0K2R9_9EURY|nr:PQQ-binding-like beta-propeller repeat protein [Natronococcus occultus]AGB38830.1 WD40-like repeat protein [Natronococcus occultus SP4]